MPLRPGTKSGKNLFAKGMQYQVLFSFKRDSYKQVFKAVRKDQRTGIQQEVLLKIFSGEKQSYREEFESLSQVFSPYCVRLFGFENFGDKKALVLEYIKGVSLFQLLSNFSLKPGEIHHILISIYKGLEDLNKQGLCHGDLSLDNVLIDEKAHIKFIDFGKANYENGIQGTPPFLAPEIVKGVRTSFSSDLYSLGVIEFFLKTPCSLSSLKDIKTEDFNSENSLLSSDPLKRFFPYNVHCESASSSDLKSLSYKVKDILSFMESKRCSTVKNPSLNPLSFFNIVKKFVLVVILVFTGVVSSQPHLPSYGWIKIYTNKWFALRIEGFESYAPFTIPLKSGWHSIQWKNQSATGTIKMVQDNLRGLFLMIFNNNK